MSSFALTLAHSFLLACSQGGNSLEQIESDITRIADQVRPTVVRVTVKASSQLNRVPTAVSLRPRLFEGRLEVQAEQELAESKQAPEIAWARIGFGNRIGSGFSLGDGYVVTTHTVAGGGEEATITNHEGKEFPAIVVGSDSITDIALLKLNEGSIAGVRLGDSVKTKIGSFGIFLSNSYGKLENVNLGFITGQEEREPGAPMLRVNFPILPGESGGPLLNSRGEVIGIASANLSRGFHSFFTTAPEADESRHLLALTLAGQAQASAPSAMESSKEFSYFIPLDRVKGVVEEIKKYGQVRRPWFGVSGSDTTVNAGNQSIQGVLVENVQEGSAAEKSQLKDGDIILRCAGQETPNFESLRQTIQRLTVGKAVDVVIRRAGAEMTLQITPESRPGTTSKKSKGGVSLGLTLVPKSKELAEFLNLTDAPEGQVVASIEDGGLASLAGIRKGDLLLSTPEPGKPCKIWRAGKALEVSIPEKR